ncbi:sun domain protein, partial [Nannochloropsis gaditana CCMP526]
ENVAFYRLSLSPNETSIPGIGLFDVNRPIADQTCWASLLVNTTTALVFTRPLQVWTIFFTNLEEGDWVDLVVPVKPGGQVEVLHGFSGGIDMPRIFYNNGITPANETLTPNANGVVHTRVTATYPLKTGECWLPGVCGGGFPECGFTGVPYTDVAAGTAALLEEACQIGTQYAAEGQDYVPPGAQPDQPFFVGVSIQGDLDETFDWSRLTQETVSFQPELAAKGFIFTPDDPSCVRPPETPADIPSPSVSLCPTDWANYGAVTKGAPQWDEMTKFYCNRWDWNTTSGQVMSCPVQPPSIPNDACGPGSGLTPLEPLPTPQFTRYQQPGVCPLPNGDPILDPDNLLLPLSSSWEQQTPWDAARPVYVDSHPWTGGWSMLPSRGYGCNIGGYCPYACRAPYYETQWDNAWAGSAYWSLSTGDPIPSFMGFGRRYIQPNGPCMGGQQGIYCKQTGQLALTAPSSQAPQNFSEMCVRGPDVVFVENRTPWNISSCRKVLPEDYMGIPTLYSPSSNSSFPTVKQGPPSTANPRVQVPMYYTDGAGVYGVSPGFKQYFTIPERDSSAPPCLNPWCQLVRYRPSTGNNNSAVVGQDYTPYEVDVSNTDLTGTFSVTLRVTSVASATGFPIAGKQSASYDTALGNPGYGIRLWSPRGEIACEGYWEGGAATKTDCSTYCMGEDCANAPCDPHQADPAAADACYNYPPLGPAGPGPYVKPVLKAYDVVQPYTVPTCSVIFPGNPGTGKVRIELFVVP